MPQSVGTASISGTASMAALRQHVEQLQSQLRLARAKQEADAALVEELQRDNTRLKQLVESASEVGHTANLTRVWRVEGDG